MIAIPSDRKKYCVVDKECNYGSGRNRFTKLCEKNIVKCSDLKYKVVNLCCCGKFTVKEPDDGWCGWEGIGCWIIEQNFIVS